MKNLSVNNLPPDVNEKLQAKLASISFAVVAQTNTIYPIEESKLYRFHEIEQMKLELINNAGQAICEAFEIDYDAADYLTLVKEFYSSNNISPPNF